MIHRIQIGDKDVLLDGGASFLIIYRKYFGRDAITDLLPMMRLGVNVIQALSGQMTDEDMAAALLAEEQLDAVQMMELIWALAKNADRDIPDFEEFYDQFDEFPFMDVMTEIVLFIVPTLLSKTDKKKRPVKKAKSQPTK